MQLSSQTSHWDPALDTTVLKAEKAISWLAAQ
jgi:hypothetical protein